MFAFAHDKVKKTRRNKSIVTRLERLPVRIAAVGETAQCLNIQFDRIAHASTLWLKLQCQLGCMCVSASGRISQICCGVPVRKEASMDLRRRSDCSNIAGENRGTSFRTDPILARLYRSYGTGDCLPVHEVDLVFRSRF